MNSNSINKKCIIKENYYESKHAFEMNRTACMLNDDFVKTGCDLVGFLFVKWRVNGTKRVVWKLGFLIGLAHRYKCDRISLNCTSVHTHKN